MSIRVSLVIWLVAWALSVALASSALALNLAVPYVGADYIWNQGYTGSGVEIGIIDIHMGDGNHPAISGNYLGSEKFVRGGTLLGSHATEVAGSAVSQDSTYTGVAPGAGWWTAQTADKFNMSSQRTQTVAAETFAQGLAGLAGNPVEVITMSIGFDGDTTAMDQWSLGLDHIVHTNGQTITVAAGNSGPGSGTLDGFPDGAYNAIIVGATGGTGSSPSQDYSNLAPFSSRGPTSDGRCKPDIVAPGSLIRTTALDSGWATVNGTSFATPIVAGGAALMIDVGQDLGYSTDPKVIKSTLLNSADKLAGWSHSSSQPLDWNQGAGQLNLENAFNQYIPGEQNPGSVLGTGWDREQAFWDTENFYSIDGNISAGELITVTLAWDRIVTDSPADGDINYISYNFDHLNNLDLFLYAADDLSTPLASSVSTIDNVEHIYYSAPQTGQYVIGVEMNGATAGESEIYGLAWHALTEPIPLDGDVTENGFVGAEDLVCILSNWGLSGATRLQGDLTDDGFVGSEDYVIVLSFWGNSSPAEPIPEPGSLLTLIAGAVALAGGKKRRNRQKRAERGLIPL